MNIHEAIIFFFFFRLHENLNYYSKSLHLKTNGFENVSRSPSVASLPLGHPHSVQPSTDINAIANTMVSTFKFQFFTDIVNNLYQLRVISDLECNQ